MHSRFVVFAVCNIRRMIKKRNTEFGKMNKSYQLQNVSIKIFSELDFLVLQKVYKNINRV